MCVCLCLCLSVWCLGLCVCVRVHAHACLLMSVSECVVFLVGGECVYMEGVCLCVNAWCVCEVHLFEWCVCVCVCVCVVYVCARCTKTTTTTTTMNDGIQGQTELLSKTPTHIVRTPHLRHQHFIFPFKHIL